MVPDHGRRLQRYLVGAKSVSACKREELAELAERATARQAVLVVTLTAGRVQVQKDDLGNGSVGWKKKMQKVTPWREIEGGELLQITVLAGRSSELANAWWSGDFGGELTFCQLGRSDQVRSDQPIYSTSATIYTLQTHLRKGGNRLKHVDTVNSLSLFRLDCYPRSLKSLSLASSWPKALKTKYP